MLVGFHEAKYGSSSFQRFQIYKKILKYNNIPYIDLEASQRDFWDSIRKLDLFIYRWCQIDKHKQIAKTILPIIENEIKVKCFPNQNTCWHYDDKIKQYYLMESNQFPMIKSWIFWTKDEALEWINNTNYPIVFKLKGGAGSSNVILLNNIKQAKVIVNRMFGRGIKPSKIPNLNNLKYYNMKSYLKKTFGPLIYRIINKERVNWQIEKNYVLFQKYLPNNKYDTRVTVIGKRAFAYRRFVRNNDFRASGSGNFDVTKENIDLKFIQIALNISKTMNFQSMAYDFLYDESGNPKFCEISYTFIDWMVKACPGYWDDDLNWHDGNYWPQYFHLVDGLGLTDMKYPDIN